MYLIVQNQVSEIELVGLLVVVVCCLLHAAVEVHANAEWIGSGITRSKLGEHVAGGVWDWFD